MAESLYGIAAPSRLVGLLFFLLERLSIRDPYNESPRIGLPVDEFDCSRKLAHIFLFAHDDRVVEAVGDEAYIRWMDDQIIGVSSRPAALKVLSKIGDSLARLHLTPNSAKTDVLSLGQARRYYHLDINAALDRAESAPTETIRERRRLGGSVRGVWKKAVKHEGIGEWEKILKRIYRLAGIAGSRNLRRRAIRDILAYPELAGRIADYMRCTGTAKEYFLFAQSVWGNEEQPYPDVNYRMMEGVLRLEVRGKEASKVRLLASSLLSGRLKIVGEPECVALAPLLILRFGDRRSLPLLRKCFEDYTDRLTSQAVRACAVVFASFGADEFDIVRKAAARMLRNPLADMVRMVESIRTYEAVPDRWKSRFSPHWDAVAGRPFVDMRSLLAVRLLGRNQKPRVREWLKIRKDEFDKLAVSTFKIGLSDYDRELLARLLPL